MVIAVIVAMQKEMASLLALLHNRKDETINGFNYITGELGNKELVLFQCGIGKVNAAVGASELIRNYHPDYLISSGCAGGLDAKLKVMEVIASTTTIYHDIFVGEAGEGLDIELPYPSDTYLINKVKELSQSSTVKIHQGQICTGDQFVTEREKLESLIWNPALSHRHARFMVRHLSRSALSVTRLIPTFTLTNTKTSGRKWPTIHSAW